MNPARICLLLLAVGLWMAPALAQSRVPRCLHGENETQVQAQRREEALDAADLINRAIDRRPRETAYPAWDALAKSPAVSALRGFAGRRGDLARKMEWGSDQPLSGWRIHYVAAENGYAFSLTDMRDTCEFAVVSNDSGAVLEARPADRRGPPRVIPLDSTQ